MKNPKLVILAAGMGSRYGGLKQMDSMDEHNDKIIDFSMYDALEAGFKDVVFIIKEAIKDVFISEVGNRVSKYMNVSYVYQELDKLPAGYEVPADRKKPWGTAHALLCAKDAIDGAPFAVINADDFYGKDAYKKIYQFLTQNEDDFAMVGYKLTNTLTDYGTVARGVCVIDNDNNLVDVKERTKIKKYGDTGAYTEDDVNWVSIPKDSLVSMNFWGFNNKFFEQLEEKFKEFLNSDKVLTSEFYIPSYVDSLIKENAIKVKVLNSLDSWFGVTYKEDKEFVVNSIKELKNKGLYKDSLWD